MRAKLPLSSGVPVTLGNDDGHDCAADFIDAAMRQEALIVAWHHLLAGRRAEAERWCVDAGATIEEVAASSLVI